VDALHGIGAVASAAAAAILVLAAVGAGTIDRWHEWVRRLALVATGVFGLQGVVGLVLMLLGGEFREGLHLLYGLGLVFAVPLGLSFASDAPDRARSWVVAISGVAALLLVWRLFSTG
jgi:heme A synthase